MTRDQELADRLKQYPWYHRIEAAPGVFTRERGNYEENWTFLKTQLDQIDFEGKRVLDIGCRDGMFSLEAESRGAREVLAIDNDLSRGAVEVLLPALGSKVRMLQLNVYDLDPAVHGVFDVVLFFGVLYHLRYPFWGLRKIVECLKDKGFLAIESGMLAENVDPEREILYCPTDNSPYEPTSCTFFNKKGLETTMRSMGCGLLTTANREPVEDAAASPPPDPAAPLSTCRLFSLFRRDDSLLPGHLHTYWNTTHDGHSSKGWD